MEARAPRLFISYRTDDAGHAASRLYDDLAELYGSESVFIDHRQIAGGEPWGQRLTTAAVQAAVMFVLIGPGWLKAQNPITGDRRLNEPDDWVRREIQTALDGGATVVPVLVDDARPLTAMDLRTVPELQRLAERQAVPLRRKDWDWDVANLQRLLLHHRIAPSDDTYGARTRHGVAGETAARIPALARFAPPAVPHHFRDRDEEIRRVIEHLRRGHWSALVAIGGSGKTAIAARIAADRLTGNGNNVAWLGLAGTLDVDVAQEWLANTFGFSVRAESSAHQRSARLRAMTAGGSKLVVLDDPPSDAVLSELMASIGPGNDVIMTAREQLPSMVRFGVSIVEVLPLPAAAATDVLLSITGTKADGSDDHREWMALAQSVGNHPLALEVLAGDLLLQDEMRPKIYLQDRIADHTWTAGDGILARLRKSVVDSVARAHSDYRIAFAALGAFDGSAFSAEAVAAVCAFGSVDEARRFLLELRRRLCVRRQSSGLYSLHPFVVETARHAQNEERTDGQRMGPPLRHVAYYSELLQKHGGYEWNIGHYPLLVAEERELVRAIETAADMAEHASAGEAHALRLQCAEMTSLISWYLHWRGHWDLRIRLCERVCTWAERQLLPPGNWDMPGIVGNLYVDQGWIYLQRGDVRTAEQCALHGLKWLRTSGDRMFAIELTGQVALKRREYARSIEAFESLRAQADEGSRVWLVFSYRLADALDQSGDRSRGGALLEDLLQRIESPSHSQQIDDVRGRILYRVALRRQADGATADAIALADRAGAAFARSGIIAAERHATIMLGADLLSESGAPEQAQQLLIATRDQAEKEGDFEMLTQISQWLADQSAGARPSNRPSLLGDI